MHSSNQCTVGISPSDDMKMMEGLCLVMKRLPSEQASMIRQQYLDHQLQEAQIILQNQEESRSERLTAILHLLTENMFRLVHS